MLRDKLYHEQGYTCCDRAQQSALKLDLYRMPFRLLMPDNQEQYRTFLGSMFSLMTIFVILAYGSYKMITLANNEEYKTQVRLKENFYEPQDVFGTETNDFMIAAAITTIDDTSESIEDETYGKIVFKRKVWDTVSLPNIDFGFVDVKSEKCAENDLNWADGLETDKSSKFYPISELNSIDLKKYGNKLKCLDESLEMKGNFDS